MHVFIIFFLIGSTGRSFAQIVLPMLMMHDVLESYTWFEWDGRRQQLFVLFPKTQVSKFSRNYAKFLERCENISSWCLITFLVES
jgi:hypothetical protein